MLIALILIPFIGAVCVLCARNSMARAMGICICFMDFLLAMCLFRAPDTYVRMDWIPQLGISFALGLDGVSRLLFLLTPLLALSVCALAPRVTFSGDLYEFVALVLFFTGVMQGLFAAQNLGLFYICYEAMLLPILVIGFRQNTDQARRAVVKFMLFTMAGSLPMLFGVLYLAFSQGRPSLDFSALRSLSDPMQIRLFMLFLAAFLVKIPLFPLHGWLVDLYDALPAQVTALVSGVMAKAGIYGLIRLGLILFPSGLQAVAPYLLWVSVFTVLYGGLCAVAAETARGLLAYASLSHMGMMAIGVFTCNASGVSGAVLQTFAHGVAMGGLFLVLSILEERGLQVDLRDYYGISTSMPWLAAFALVLVMTVLGLPGLGSFPGELLVLAGIYQVTPGGAALAAVAVLLAGWYILRFYQLLMHGAPQKSGVADLRLMERLALSPLIVIVLWLGISPSVFVSSVGIWFKGVSL